MGVCVSMPTCTAQFHSVYTRATCSFRLVKMNNKSDVVAGARGVGGRGDVGRVAGARGLGGGVARVAGAQGGGGGGMGVVERRGLWGKRHGSCTKQEL